MTKSKSLGCWLVLGALLLVLGLVGPVRAQEGAPVVLTLTIDGPITSSTTGYIERGITRAQEMGAEALVILLDTPGGQVNATFKIMENFENAPVPVLVYVSPRGGQAMSAGMYIVLSAHGAAMAPNTTIGAAHPIDGSGENLDSVADEKLVNALLGKMQNATEGRGAEAAQWTENAVRESVVATDEEALKLNVVDVVAESLPEVLSQFDGREILVGGRTVTLNLKGAFVEPLPPTPVEQLLQFLTDPNILAILLVVGVLAILIEVATPGGWVAGFLGVVCLALAAYGMGAIPINWLGGVFVLISFVLFFLDIKTPTQGPLTAAGLGSLIAGLLIMFNTPVGSPFGQVSVPLVIGLALMSAAIFSFVIAKAVQIMRGRPVTGAEALLESSGIARSELNPEGMVLVKGALWRAVAQEPPIPAGTTVVVVGRNGLVLHVRRA